MLYVLMDEAVRRGAITYCKGHFYNSTEFQVIPDSIKIVDYDIFQDIIDEIGYSPEDTLDILPKGA